MRKPYINFILFTAVFSMTYGGFLYQHYSSEENSDISTAVVAEAEYSEAAVHNKENSDDISTVVTEASYEDVTPSQGNEPTDYYPQSEKNDARILAYASNPAVDGTANNSVADSSSFNTASDFVSTSDQTATQPVSVSTRNKTNDGSEFLPTGASQQDVFADGSKYPRVYTIKDYQAARIDCTQSSANTSAHAKLMYGMKGC